MYDFLSALTGSGAEGFCVYGVVVTHYTAHPVSIALIQVHFSPGRAIFKLRLHQLVGISKNFAEPNQCICTLCRVRDIQKTQPGWWPSGKCRKSCITCKSHSSKVQTSNHGPAEQPKNPQQATILKENNNNLLELETCYILSAFVKCRVKSLMSSLDDNRSCFKCCPLSTLCPPLPARWCCTRTPRHIVQLKAPKFYPRDGFVRASSLQRSPFYLQYPPHHVQSAWQGRGGCKHAVFHNFMIFFSIC